MGKELTWDQVHAAMRWMAAEKSEWAGVPLPLPDMDLVLENKYPYKGLGEFNWDEEKQAEAAKRKVVNSWYNPRLRGNVVLFKENGGRVEWGFQSWKPELMGLETLGAVNAWPMEAEWKAMEKLQGLINDHRFKCYLMTGSFVETSQRSKVSYIFRRLRPTIAIKADEKGSKVLCCLCRHSLGYYAGTFAGVMVPTDEVIGSLLLMRGDEPYFWRTSNQHPAWLPNSGL